MKLDREAKEADWAICYVSEQELRVRGRVVDGFGSPISGALVEASATESDLTFSGGDVETRPDGTFNVRIPYFAVLPLQRGSDGVVRSRLGINVRHPTFLFHSHPLREFPFYIPDIVLSPAPPLRGAARNGLTKVPLVSFEVATISYFQKVEFHGVESASGEFDLGPTTGGTLVVRANGYSTELRHIQSMSGEEWYRETVDLFPATTLRGKVVDVHRLPVVNAAIFAGTVPSSPALMEAVAWAYTDENGRFRTNSTPSWTTRLVARAENGAMGEASVSAGGDEDQQVLIELAH